MVIKIKDEDYTLEYNNRELFAIEERVDKPITTILSNENELGKLSTMYSIIYCGIQEPITFDDLVENLSPLELNNIIMNVLELVKGAFEPKVKKKGLVQKIKEAVS